MTRDETGPWFNNCAVRERPSDGVSVGRCWFYLKDDVCPRHGDVTDIQNHYRKTGELGEDPRDKISEAEGES